jgi:hypothetical protein
MSTQEIFDMFEKGIEKEHQRLDALPRIHKPGEAMMDVVSDDHLDDLVTPTGSMKAWASTQPKPTTPQVLKK